MNMSVVWHQGDLLKQETENVEEDVDTRASSLPVR